MKYIRLVTSFEKRIRQKTSEIKNLPHTQGGELIYMSVANVYKVEGGMRIVNFYK